MENQETKQQNLILNSVEFYDRNGNTIKLDQVGMSCDDCNLEDVIQAIKIFQELEKTT